MEKNLTGIKDVDLKILSNLDDRSLMNFCKVSTYANTLCYNENFWRERIVQKYPDAFKFKSKTRTWRDYYLNIVIISSKFSNKNEAMFEAVKTGQKDLVEFFISQGANDFHNGMTSAAFYGNKDLVLFFISKAKGDGEWNKYDWNRGMIRATLGGHEDLVLFFISKGADDFNVGLANAAYKGNKKLIDLFISLGANNWDYALFYAKHGENRDIIIFFENKINRE